jgi:hypothetical protein
VASSSEPKKLVLSQKAKDGLPGYLKLVMHRFEVRKVWVPGEHVTLPPASPPGMHYAPEDQPEYVAYCRSMLDQGKVTQGIAKSMLVGLRGCGKAGKELAEEIKKKILRK